MGNKKDKNYRLLMSRNDDFFYENTKLFLEKTKEVYKSENLVRFVCFYIKGCIRLDFDKGKMIKEVKKISQKSNRDKNKQYFKFVNLWIGFLFEYPALIEIFLHLEIKDISIMGSVYVNYQGKIIRFSNHNSRSPKKTFSVKFRKYRVSGFETTIINAIKTGSFDLSRYNY